MCGVIVQVGHRMNICACNVIVSGMLFCQLFTELAEYWVAWTRVVVGRTWENCGRL